MSFMKFHVLMEKILKEATTFSLQALLFSSSVQDNYYFLMKIIKEAATFPPPALLFSFRMYKRIMLFMKSRKRNRISRLEPLYPGQINKLVRSYIYILNIYYMRSRRSRRARGHAALREEKWHLYWSPWYFWAGYS